MPLFASSSGVQINGGSFYDIAGGMNVQSIQPPGYNYELVSALEFNSTQGSNRRSLGPERHGRMAAGGAARMSPYDSVFRPQIPSHGHGSSFTDHRPSFTSTSSTFVPALPGPILYPHPTPESQCAFVEPAFHPVLHSLAKNTNDNLSGSQNSSVDNRCLSVYAGDSAITYPSTDLELASNAIGQPDHLIDGGDLPQVESAAARINYPILQKDNSQYKPETSINGGTFIGGNVTHIQRHGETGLHLLYRAAANDAFHDSAERFPPPRCHPETRTEMLDDLYNWCSREDPVLWLYGPAGAGKSAIAQSFCQKLQAEGRLGGSFFFKRGHASRGNANKLFTTIALKLAVLLPELNKWIPRQVEKDPSILDAILSKQLKELIIDPVRHIPDHNMVIVIDGLDECEGEDVQKEILRSIGNAIQDRDLPLRFLIASRAEPHISDIFREQCLNGFHHPFNIQQSFEDVSKYLQTQFARIHREHQETMASISSPWPSREVIRTLVDKSSGYFIFAATVIKFVDDKNFRPTERVAVIMAQIMGIKEPDVASPLAALDQLYIQILSAVPFRPQLLRMLTVIAAKFDYLTISHIEQLLQLQSGDIRLALRGLHSVIKMPPVDNDWEGPNDSNGDCITVHHVSFRDFLLDPARSGSFYVGDIWHRTDLASHVLQAFSYTQDGSWQRRDHVAWWFDWNRTISLVTSIPPSPDLVAFVRLFNLDFFFWTCMEEDENLQLIIGWLKKIEPFPQDLINLWEESYFMLSCHRIWIQTTHVLDQMNPFNQVVLRPSPQLLRILHAYTHLADYADAWSSGSQLHINNIRNLLDLSWEELRAAICPLKSLLGGQRNSIARLLAYTLDPTPGSFLVRSDLAHGFMHIIRKCCTTKRQSWFHTLTCSWGRHVRSCPPCPDLLQNLCNMESDLKTIPTDLLGYYMNDFHDLVQWLKTFPEPPLRLIIDFEHHLERAINLANNRNQYTFDYLETGWRRSNTRRLGRQERLNESRALYLGLCRRLRLI
ncbi:hypothetical protein C8R44DRAFT_859837 [Mycena epipterygia]|nr:hypothetical protein C8R44DRAFT_859837 [Mycena epipterygia]